MILRDDDYDTIFDAINAAVPWLCLAVAVISFGLIIYSILQKSL